jgi:hypothetical protein
LCRFNSHSRRSSALGRQGPLGEVGTSGRIGWLRDCPVAARQTDTEGAGRHHGFPLKGPRDLDRDRMAYRDLDESYTVEGWKPHRRKPGGARATNRPAPHQSCRRAVSVEFNPRIDLLKREVDAKLRQAHWPGRVGGVPVPCLLTRFTPERTE